MTSRTIRPFHPVRTRLRRLPAVITNPGDTFTARESTIPDRGGRGDGRLDGAKLVVDAQSDRRRASEPDIGRGAVDEPRECLVADDLAIAQGHDGLVER